MVSGSVILSLPSRERGLKLKFRQVRHEVRSVAPFAGAWIETQKMSIFTLAEFVAPFAGAWIETGGGATSGASSSVAPFAGAWIETHILAIYFSAMLMSLPSRERGLKRYNKIRCFFDSLSLPSRERGLKLPKFRRHNRWYYVAPFVGAWIKCIILIDLKI